MNPEIGILKKELEIADDSQILEILEELSDIYYTSDLDLSVDYARQGLEMAKTMGDEDKQTIFYLNLLTGLNRLVRREEFEAVLEDAKEFAKVAPPQNQVKLLNQFSIFCLMQKKPLDAIPILDEALKIQEKIDYPKAKVSLLINYGIVYSDLYQLEKAAEILYDALEIAEKENYEDFRMSILVNLSNVFYKLNKMDKKMELLKDALAIGLMLTRK